MLHQSIHKVKLSVYTRTVTLHLIFKLFPSILLLSNLVNVTLHENHITPCPINRFQVCRVAFSFPILLL